MATSVRCLWAALAVFIFSDCNVSALVQRTRGQDEVVCVSIAAYEDEDFIDALLKNAIQFSEPSTKFVLHLNAKSNYTDQALAKWETDRVSVSPARVPVRKFGGAILYGHILNAQQMDRRWTGTCKYYVMQASNMMWVRPGYESVVRQRRFGEFRRTNDAPGCAARIEFTKDVTAPKKVYGWSKPEGAFYPMDTVRGFDKLMRQHVLAHKDPDAISIYAAMCNLETFELQMYAFNWNEFSDEQMLEHQKAKGLSYTNCTGESVTVDEVEAVANGKVGFESYYAVKRVSRDLNHPVTKYIMAMRH